MAPKRKTRWIPSIWRNKVTIVITLILFIIAHQIYLETAAMIDTPIISNDEPIEQSQHKQTNDNIQHDIEQRIIPETRHCINPYVTNKYNSSYQKYQRLDISKLANNWIYFVNRCEINKKKFDENSHGDFDSLWMNTKIGYFHNYKCGGSTIQRALSQLSKKDLKGKYLYKDPRRKYIHLFVSNSKFMNDSGWKTNPAKWYKILSDMFLFTFVRDPIDRFLSSFYEVHTRNHSANRIWKTLKVDQYSGINRLRKLVQHFQQNMNEYMFNKDTLDIDIKNLWKGEKHFHPQMLFLWNAKYEYFPFDYIGNLKHFDEAMKMILDEFSDFLHFHPEEYDKFVRHLREREGVENKDKYKKKKNYINAKNKEYYITRDKLNDDDIRGLCETYWIDYICMPFQIPKQCDIQQLFRKYFNRFVKYNDCYFS